MMHQNMPRYEPPETVDELVDLLLSDLTAEHRRTLSAMTHREFERFYLAVAEALLEEFGLWTGNEKLLASCMSEAGEDSRGMEPARIVLKKMRSRISEDPGIFIVT